MNWSIFVSWESKIFDTVTFKNADRTFVCRATMKKLLSLFVTWVVVTITFVVNQEIKTDFSSYISIKVSLASLIFIINSATYGRTARIRQVVFLEHPKSSLVRIAVLSNGCHGNRFRATYCAARETESRFFILDFHSTWVCLKILLAFLMYRILCFVCVQWWLLSDSFTLVFRRIRFSRFPFRCCVLVSPIFSCR